MHNHTIEELLAKQAVAEVINRYSRAIDRLDEGLLRSVFHPGSQHNHFYEGPSSDPSAHSSPGAPGDFVAFAFEVLSTYSRTHHQLGTLNIELDGDAFADAETYFTAFHRVRAQGDPKAGGDAPAQEMDYFVGGRYIDRFACIDGDWRIIRRTGITDWTRMDPITSSDFGLIDPATIGRRKPDDFWYRRADG